MRHLGWTPGHQLEPRDKDCSEKDQRTWMKMGVNLAGDRGWHGEHVGDIGTPMAPGQKTGKVWGCPKGGPRLTGALPTKDSPGPEQQGNPGCVQLPLVSSGLASGGRYGPSPGGSISISRPSSQHLAPGNCRVVKPSYKRVDRPAQEPGRARLALP